MMGLCVLLCLAYLLVLNVRMSLSMYVCWFLDFLPLPSGQKRVTESGLEGHMIARWFAKQYESSIE